MYCLDVLSYKLDVLSYKLDVLSYKLDVLSYNLDVLSYKLSYMLRQNNFASATCIRSSFLTFLLPLCVVLRSQEVQIQRGCRQVNVDYSNNYVRVIKKFKIYPLYVLLCGEHSMHASHL